MTVSLTITAADGATTSISLPDPNIIPSGTAILPADRMTDWSYAGLQRSGGIPSASWPIGVNAPAPLGGGQDDAPNIQAAINSCPVGQVVQLKAGTYNFNSNGNLILINKGVVLRGAGGKAGQTIIQKTGGAQLEPGQATGSNPTPAVIIGPGRYGFWTNGGPDAAGGNVDSAGSGGVNLTSNGVHGAFSVNVADAHLFQVGMVVLLDELSKSQWMPDVVTTNNTDGYKIWASPDYKTTWKLHNPNIQYVDDFSAGQLSTTPNSFGDFVGNRLDRPHAEIKHIVSISGKTITFDSPIHGNYRVANTAQLTRFTDASSNAWVDHIRNAGVENIVFRGFDDGTIVLNMAFGSWIKACEVDVWSGQNVAFVSSMRCECRQLYSHGSAYPQPMGGSYALCLDKASSEILIEDSISVKADKVMMVARRSGAGSVIGYSYADMGYIDYSGTWCEIGLNASHLVGSHHVLIEGCWGFNGDSDNTHGASVFITYFRNWLTGFRNPYVNLQDGITYNDLTNSATGPKRCAGCQDYSYWFSFVGNVLGTQGHMSGWVYEQNDWGAGPGVWLMGWCSAHNGATAHDTQINSSSFPGHIIRDGNWDWLQSKQSWHNTPARFVIPNSLYLSSKPPYFGNNPWPWVNPSNGATFVLPAKARFDAGTPNSI